eukprot:11951638-Ditylum_brightwellii.AAC.1
MQPNDNVQQAIEQTLSELGTPILSEHVKGHQDKGTKYSLKTLLQKGMEKSNMGSTTKHNC